jgi:hypothetical protein
MVPWPVQRALVAGLCEDAHVAAIKDRLRRAC